MEDETEYDIVYTLRRRKAGEEDFSEIGFGASGMWARPQECAHMVIIDIDTFRWETEAGMPEPAQIKADLEGE